MLEPTAKFAKVKNGSASLSLSTQFKSLFPARRHRLHCCQSQQMRLALKKWKKWSLKASCSAKNQACIQSYFIMHQHRSPKMGSVCNICVCRKAEEEFSIADDDWECHSRCPKETQTGPSHRKCAAGRLAGYNANSYAATERKQCLDCLNMMIFSWNRSKCTG